MCLKHHDSYFYNDYSFDWTIECKDGKLKFSVTNVILNKEKEDGMDNNNKLPPNQKNIVVTMNSELPYPQLIMRKKLTVVWKLSKEAFIKNVESLALSLYANLINKSEDW